MKPGETTLNALNARAAWAAARIAAAPPQDWTTPPNKDVLDNLIVWHMTAPKFNQPTESTMAQRSWTIEIRADYADRGKNEPINHMVKKKALELFAMLQLLKDNGQAPDIACWSEDFFHGRTDLAIFAKDTAEATAAEAQVAEVLGEEAPVSDELMAAASEIMHANNNKTK